MLDYLRLIRLPYVFTALADVCAGIAVGSTLVNVCFPGFHPAYGVTVPAIVLTLVISLLIYSAGMALNDFADVAKDSKKFPGRPIPSGRVSARSAFVTGVAMLGAALIVSLFVGQATVVVSFCLAGVVLGYDFGVKRWALAGALGIGLARGLNMLLGASSFVDVSCQIACGWPSWTSMHPSFILPVEVLCRASSQWSGGFLCPVMLFLYASGVSFMSSLEDRGIEEARRYFAPALLWMLVPVILSIFVIQMNTASVIALFALLVYLAMSAVGAYRSLGGGPGRAISSLVRSSLVGIILLDGAFLISMWRVGEGIAVTIGLLVMFVTTEALVWKESV